MRFGVNYTPSTGWFHHWLDFSIDDVKADFESIAALGLDHVRVFPLWPVFQPNRGLVRPKAVEQLAQMLDAADETGLDVQVDVLQGHLSSFDFYPSWVQTWHRRNIFTDPEVISGQRFYVRTLAEALRDKPNFLGFTLGNEVNLLTESNPCTPEQASAWIDTLLTECDSAAPGLPHVHSEYDAVWYESEHSFLPEHAANLGAMTTVHSWVFNGTAQRYGPLSPESVHHAEYLVENNAEGLLLFAKVAPYLERFRKDRAPTAFQHAEWVARETAVGRQRVQMFTKRIETQLASR